MARSRAWRRLRVVVVAALGLGAVLGFGPFAGPVPPEKVTDPREMIARGLQAILDSTSVHVDGTVSGRSRATSWPAPSRRSRWTA